MYVVESDSRASSWPIMDRKKRRTNGTVFDVLLSWASCVDVMTYSMSRSDAASRLQIQKMVTNF